MFDTQRKRKHDSVIYFFCFHGNKEQKHNKQQGKNIGTDIGYQPNLNFQSIISGPEFKNAACAVCKTFKIKVLESGKVEEKPKKQNKTFYL